MAKSYKAMSEETKNLFMNQIMAMLTEKGEDAGKCGTNELNFPVVLEDGTETFIVVKVSMPTGTRDGDAYDGYAMRDEYAQKCQEKAEKAKAQAEAKAKKIARDKANREKLAQSKAQHTAK